MILKLMQDNERIYKLNIYNNQILSCIKFTDSGKNSQIGFLENRIRSVILNKIHVLAEEKY